MAEALLRTPPRTLKEVWESLPEGTLCQLINNTLVMSPAPIDVHQKILGDIYFKFRQFLEGKELGEVRIAPYDVHLDDENIFQPDMFFIAKENAHKIKDHLYGAPDLVIEILSPSNQRYDKKDKKAIYEKYGVKEYFIIEPVGKTVTSFILIKDEFIEKEQTTGVVKSSLLEASFTF